MRGLLSNRNILLLVCAQIVFVSSGGITVTIGGIVGSALAPEPSLVTLPVSLMVVGTAVGTVPAAQLMQRIGRRLGFVMAALIAAGSAAASALALTHTSFWLFCAGTFGTGISLAFSQQFRFAAAESVAPAKAAAAVSIILLGSVGGAILGPELVAQSQRIAADSSFSGALLGSSALFITAAILLTAFKNISIAVESTSDTGAARPLQLLLKQPLYVLAVAAGVIGQGVMTFVMTATPVSMHIVDGHSIGDTAQVIRLHVLAMYLPSLASGLLIAQFGERMLMAAGLAIYVVTLFIGLAGQAVMHYGAALILLGIGWNFLFVGGTTLLVQTYLPSERFKAQGFNEAAVFGTAALGSLMAGVVLDTVGWTAVVVSMFIPVAVLALALIILRRSSVETVPAA